MKKDKKWLKQEIENMCPMDVNGEEYLDLDRVFELVDQLDEPQKVVVPKWFDEWVTSNLDTDAESDWIKQGLIHELWDFEDGPNADKQEEVYSNQIKYIRAILDGFTIANEDEELWKPIENYEGLYEVSNKGNVRSLDRDVQYKKTDFTMKIKGVDLKPNVFKKGYLQVGLSKNGKLKSMLVHRLVMNAFNPTTDESLQINHIDGNKENNEVSNLEWVTAIENTNHAYDIGLRDDTIGNNRKLTEDEVLEIIDLYETGNYTQKELGNKYNVGRNTIGEILLGKTWGWLTGITREVKVEKEKRYYVDFGKGFYLERGYADRLSDISIYNSTKDWLTGDGKEFAIFTEAEIKAIDKRYWAFAVPVEEVEE